METDEQVIQLRGDEQEPDGEVFLGEVPDEAPAGKGAVEAFDEPVDIVIDFNELPVSADAVAQAIRELDAEKAGDAARPQCKGRKS